MKPLVTRDPGYEIGSDWSEGIQGVLDDFPPPFDPGRIVQQVKRAEREHRVSRPIISRSNTRRRFMVAFALATSLLIILSFSIFRPKDAWAQIASSVDAMAWVRLRAILTDPASSDAAPSIEHWYSPRYDLQASRTPQEKSFVDLGQSRKEIYRDGDDSVFEMPMNTSVAATTLGAVAAGFFAGDIRPGAVFHGYRIESVSESETNSKIGGRVFEFFGRDTRWAGGAELTIAGKLTMSESDALPAMLEITMTNGTRKSDPRSTVKFAIDYPADGPRSVYDLDVGQDIPVVSRLPNQRLQQALSAMRSSRESFGDYIAYICEVPGELKYLLRTSGKRLRLDECLSSKDLDEPVDSDIDAWTAERWEGRLTSFELRPMVICDGQTIWQYGLKDVHEPFVVNPQDIESWIAEQAEVPDWYRDTPNGTVPVVPKNVLLEVYGPRKRVGREHTVVRKFSGDRAVAESLRGVSPLLPEGLAYPPVGISTNFETTIHASTGGENENALVIELRRTEPPSMRTMWEWASVEIDPDRGFVARRESYRDRTDYSDPSDLLVEFDATTFQRHLSGHRQTPDGIWYPTVSRYTGLRSKNGERLARPLTHHFFLDFDAEFNEDVFRVND